MKAKIAARVAAICVLALGAFSLPVFAQYTVNGSQTNQVINGFGVNLNHRNWNGNEIKPVLDKMIDQGGFSIFRVVFDNTDWMPTNNPSPAALNAIYGSARFAKLWDLVAYLNQKGITTNGIMFSFQGPGALWMGGASLTPNQGYEAQWALMMSSFLNYARNVRHLKFNLVAPHNEPDSSSLNGIGTTTSQYITMLDLLSQNLNSNGMSDIKFVGPDLGSTSTSWMQQMMGDSVIMGKLSHFGVHTYQSGGSGTSVMPSFISSSAYPKSTFWVTEFNNQCTQCYQSVYNTNNYNWTYCSGTAQYLIYHLANGASAGLAWEGYDSYYQLLPMPWLQSGNQAGAWSFYGLFGVDSTNAAPKTYTARKHFYTMSQISAFVPPGSQRLGISGSQNSSFMMLPFYHAASGRITLVGFNTGNQTAVPINLQSLPAIPALDLYYTDSDTNLAHSATFTVSSNNSCTAIIPGDCIFTLTGFDPTKTAVSVQMSFPANGAQFTAPWSVPLAASASSTTGTVTNVTFYSGGTPLGSAGSDPFYTIWNNLGTGTYVVNAVATDSAGNSGTSSNITFTLAGPPAQIVVVPTNTTAVLPTNATVPPYGQQRFAATVVDGLGTPLSPQPALSWQTQTGTIDGNGLLTAEDDLGPFVVSVNSGNLSGSVNVTVTNNNLATNGIGYVWYNLSSNTGFSPQYEAPGINDGDTNSNVSLLAEFDGSSDFSNYYEAAGVIWSMPQTISNVVFINGTTSGGNGTFGSGLQLQFTTNGASWFPAGSQWTVSPSYNYNSSANSPVPYVFSGTMATVLGARCVGQVNTGHGSAYVNATEVQAFMGAPPPLLTSPIANGVVVSWPGPVTNCILQTTTNLQSPWTTVTNAKQVTPWGMSVTVSPASALQYFRLRFP